MVGISIIIPCYNCQETIIRALDSINLNNRNIEAIVVDDCSFDNSFDIVFNYKNENPDYNIILIKNQNNLGPGETRNKAINLATKDYIMFLDSDDTLVGNYYNKLVLALNQNFDCIIFDAFRIYKNNKRYFHMFFTNKFKSGLIDLKEAFVYSKGCTWGKIYKKDIIFKNNIKFGNTKRGEDLVFTKLALANCENVFYLNIALYNYIDNPNSLMHRKQLDYDSLKNSYKNYEIISSKIDGTRWKNELNSLFMLEVIYVTSMRRLSLFYNFQESKREFINLLKYYNQNDTYFSRYNYKYKLVFKILRLLYCI